MTTKGFHWKLKGLKNFIDEDRYYLNEIMNSSAFILSGKKMFKEYTTIFTQKEYDKMVEDKLIADIFEKEEIEN